MIGNDELKGIGEMIDKLQQEAVEKYKKEHGWIPCSERLPEKPAVGEEGYLVQVSCAVQPFSAYWNGSLWIDAEDNVVIPVAWMPLPEPYREVR